MLHGSVAAAPPASPAGGAVTAASPFTFPSDLAGLPGTPQYSRGAQQKTLAGLLRGFEAVTAAEVVITGPDDAPRVSVVLRPRPGRLLDAELLGSLTRLLLGAVPGLLPTNLQISSTTGQLLYGDGRVLSVPAPRSSSADHLPWLLMVAMLGGLAAAWPHLQRRRRPVSQGGPEGHRDPFAALDDRTLARVLDGERPGLATVLQTVVGGRDARRLARYARRRRLPAPPGPADLDPEVAEAVLAALQRRGEHLSRSGTGSSG